MKFYKVIRRFYVDRTAGWTISPRAGFALSVMGAFCVLAFAAMNIHFMFKAVLP